MVAKEKIEGADYRLEDVYSCIQCGGCTSICVAADNNKEYNPRKIVYLQRLQGSDDIKKPSIKNLLESVEVAECFQCYSCADLCPAGVSPGDIMKYMREVNKKRGKDRYAGILKENLLEHGQSIVPEVFDSADEIWGKSWKELRENKRYNKRPPKKRNLSPEVTKEINYLINSAENLNLREPKEEKLEPKELKNVDELVLFESCCGASHYPGIGNSSKYILDRLRIDYKILDEQSCCGGFAYYGNDLDINEIVLIGARNQGIIENESEIVTSVCPSCFSSNLEVNKILSNEENKKQVNDVLSTIGKEVNGNLNITHIQEILYDNIDLVKENIERDFSGLKVATHTGCHYKNFNLRSDKGKILDELVKITGAELVDYPSKNRCCGGGFEKSFVGEVDKVRGINYNKQKDIQNTGADLVVLNCPGCKMTFDRNNSELNKIQQLDLGYIHITELLALAMGADPYKIAGVQYHSVPLDDLLKKYGIKEEKSFFRILKDKFKLW